MQKSLTIDQAMAEAERCLLCHDAPCSASCPAGTDPAKFIRKLRFKNITGAIRTIKENNIMGGACGMLCPAHRLCEKECSAKGLDRPIKIGAIQTALVEHGWKTGFYALAPGKKSGKKVAVIGAGPAGLSCSAELAKNGYDVTVFEEMAEPGGVLRYGVPPHRFAPEFLDKEISDIKRLGVKFECSSRIAGAGAIEGLLKKGFAAVFVAPGLWKPVTIGPMDRATAKNRSCPIYWANGVLSAVEFLKNARGKTLQGLKKAVKGKRVAVLGGGSVAIDCAESALRMGAEDVYLIYRRSFSQMPAEPDELASAQEMGVDFLLLNQPTGYVKDGKGRLKAVKLVRTELGKKDKSGRRAPVNVKGGEWKLPVDIVIEAIGNAPEEDIKMSSSGVRFTRDGLVVADTKNCRTSVKGIFAGGDIVRGPSLVVNAVADGKAAAKAIMEMHA